MKKLIFPILSWAVSVAPLFSQQPATTGIETNATSFNYSNTELHDTIVNVVVIQDVALNLNPEVASSNEVDQPEAAEADALFMFPNPTSGVVRVKLSGKVSVYIYSLTGQLIKRFYMSPGDKMLDLSDLPAGMYQVRAKSDDDYYSGKLLVQ